jgi:hypothetical protein
MPRSSFISLSGLKRAKLLKRLKGGDHGVAAPMVDGRLMRATSTESLDRGGEGHAGCVGGGLAARRGGAEVGNQRGREALVRYSGGFWQLSTSRGGRVPGSNPGEAASNFNKIAFRIRTISTGLLLRCTLGPAPIPTIGRDVNVPSGLRSHGPINATVQVT